jgi:hypothetical protein
MQIIRECRMRTAILTGLAKDAPELEVQLLYVAKEYLALAVLREQLNADADRRDHKLPARHLASHLSWQPLPFQTGRAMSAIGPKQTWPRALHMSALGARHDFLRCERPLLTQSGHSI